MKCRSLQGRQTSLRGAEHFVFYPCLFFVSALIALDRSSGRSSGDAIGRDQRESVMRGVRRNPGSLSSTTTWESTRGSGASQREHDEHKDGAMAPPHRETNGRQMEEKQADGSWR